MWLIQIFFWLQAFVCPVILAGISILVFWKNADDYTFPIIAGSIGVITGIIVAEYIRRKVGLDVFFGRI